MKSKQSLKALVRCGLIEKPSKDLAQVEAQFATRLTEEMRTRIKQPHFSDPIYRQFIPSAQELAIQSDQSEDPIGDLAYSPVKGLVHRHEDRCLLMPLNVCAVYCRFCFRREFIGPGSAALTPRELESALHYIREHQEIWEVILTGGDPLLLKSKLLQKLIEHLVDIPHIKVIRIHTRIPLVDPERISLSLLRALSCYRPIYLVLHTNHVQEFSKKGLEACARLIDSGVVMLSQSVLLKGVNDDLKALSDLMRLLVEHRIKPYYIHQLDKARGTGHFEVPIAQGKALMQALRKQLSGLCQPLYVLDEARPEQGKRPLI